jgi:transposase InsO family protein
MQPRCEALLAWQVRYNTHRPHQALGCKTPAEYRAEKLGLAIVDAA